MRLPWRAEARPDEFPPQTMIVGLGNPGRRYASTRHNVGFMVVDALASRAAAVWRPEQQALVARCRLDDLQLLLVKPQTFMNLSGKAVAPLLARHTLPTEALLVVSDDLDLPFARLRIRRGGSPGGHNGLRSLIGELHTDAFPRLRVGIGRPEEGDPIEYVLAPFTDVEQRDLDHLCAEAADEALYLARHGVGPAMNRYNGRPDARLPLAAPSAVAAAPTHAAKGAGALDGAHGG